VSGSLGPADDGPAVDGAPTARRVEVPIAVVVPSYRRKERLAQALRSVDAQRRVRPSQVIVVDDASGDGTAELARSLGARVIERDTNGGQAAARNSGMRAAEGADWIALLDDDDEWLPDHLATLWSNRNGHVLVAGTSVRVRGRQTRAHGSVSEEPEVVRSPARLLFPENSFTISAAMVRRDVLMEAGGFNEGIRHAEDVDAWLRVLEHGTGLLLAEVTCRYNVHGAGQMSGNRPEALAVYREVLQDYQDRPWLTKGLLQRFETVAAWDDLQAGRARRDWREVRKQALWLARRPARLAALTRLWAFRWRARHRRYFIPGS
jgi:glycosyltransferase involved in cell wall biosynthesis